MGYYTERRNKPVTESAYPPYLIIPFDGKEYDQYGNWIREYYNDRVPFNELAMPRNEQERVEWRKRAAKELRYHTRNIKPITSFEEDGIVYKVPTREEIDYSEL